MIKEYKNLSKNNQDVLLYIGSWLVFILLMLAINNRPLYGNVNATNYSIIWFTCFMFLIPFFLKLVFRKLDSRESKYLKLFNFQFIIAVLYCITAMILILADIKTYDKTSYIDFYFVLKLLKISIHLLIYLLGIILLYKALVIFMKKLKN